MAGARTDAAAEVPPQLRPAARIEARVLRGPWRRRRTALAVALVLFYLALPFLSVGGAPLLRIDLPHARATVAGFQLTVEDLAFLAVLALVAVVGLILLTATLGRVFCGWLCPHSVFLELVVRPLEQRLLGRRPARGARPAAWRRLAAWAVIAVIAGAVGNAGTALFVGTEAFRWGLVVDPVAHPTAAACFAAIAAFAFLDLAWFRHRACTMVCPYGRLQSLMADAHSPAPLYDAARGDPRGRPSAKGGDCVDCDRCVAVCPTGIDIRNGPQLECLHCTACIDACDPVMLTLGREPGLIRFATPEGLAGRRARPLRGRTVAYAAAIAALASAGVAMAAARQDLAVVVLRGAGAPTADAERVHQVVRVAVTNRSGDTLVPTFTVDVPGSHVLAQRSPRLAPGERAELALLIETPRAALLHDRRATLAVAAGDRTGHADLLLRNP